MCFPVLTPVSSVTICNYSSDKCVDGAGWVIERMLPEVIPWSFIIAYGRYLEVLFFNQLLNTR